MPGEDIRIIQLSAETGHFENNLSDELRLDNRSTSAVICPLLDARTVVDRYRCNEHLVL
jgi:hypothetical protein